MSTLETLSWLCLLRAARRRRVLTLAGTRISRQVAAWRGTGFALVSFAASLAAALKLHHEPKCHHHGAREHVFTLYTWAALGQLPRRRSTSWSTRSRSSRC